MKILIDTDGFGCNTKVFINDIEQEKLTYFTITARKNGKTKCQMSRETDKRGNGKSIEEFISYYGEDFKKNDELYRGNNEFK